MAQSVRIEINEGHKLYKYCDRLTKAAGALWNAALSRITHGAAMCGKRESVMTAAERRVWNELMAVLPIIRSEPWFVVSPAVFLVPGQLLGPPGPPGSARMPVDAVSAADHNVAQPIKGEYLAVLRKEQIGIWRSCSRIIHRAVLKKAGSHYGWRYIQYRKYNRR